VIPKALGLVLAAAALLPDGEITPAEIRAHVAFLASEDLAGRGAGHAGAERAADYIAKRFESYGFRPLRECWQIPFPVRCLARGGEAKLLLAGERIEDGTRVQVPNFSAAGVVRVPVATAGAGAVTGKIVAAPAEADEREQAAQLFDRGAGAVVLLRDRETLEPTPPPPEIQFVGEVEIEEILAVSTEEERRQLLDTIRLPGPVVAVSTRVRDAVLECASSGREMSVEVARVGRDESTSVLGILRGADPELRGEYVVIGGHYDHIGTDESGTIFPGADDNASGTSALLEIAEAFGALELRPRRSIVVAAWGAEEQGIAGSKAFCKAPPIDLGKVAAKINLDMIGRNDPDAIQVLASSDELHRIAVAAANRHGFARTEGDPLYLGASDSAPFVHRKVPSVFFTSGEHEDFNTPRDTADRLDADKVARVARAAFDVALEVANADTRPAFSAPSGGSPK